MSAMHSVIVAFLLANDAGYPTRVLLFGGALAVFSTICLFAPKKMLTNPAVTKIIGVENPWVVRIVCLIGASFGWFIVISWFALKSEP